jgi:endonuclease YncB( thermonuclease family)
MLRAMTGRPPRSLPQSVALIACALTLIAAQAADTACRLESLGAGIVVSVIDGRSFLLDDGREVRLAGLQVPLPARAGDKDDIAGRAAKAALESLLAGQAVTLKAPKSASDRYGRMVAYAFVSGAESPVQHSLLLQGHAFVAARPDHRACHAELLAREKVARDAKLGLWADPVYAMRRAESGTALLAARGQFAVIEGKVFSVRESGGTIYVNFGRRWSQSLTLTIRKRDARQFAAAGIEPKKLEGRLVRVRGHIEERGGARLEALHPEQIELAEQN